MTMDTITAAAAALTAAEQAYNGKSAAIDAALNLAEQRVGDTQRTFYVDQSNGDDAAQGTLAEPLASLDEAINRTVHMGSTIAYLIGDYEISTRLQLRAGVFRIRGVNGNETLSFADGVTGYSTSADQTYSPHIGMNLNGTRLRFSDLNIQLGTYAGLNDINCAVNLSWGGMLILQDVNFTNIATSDQMFGLKGTASSLIAFDFSSDVALDGRWLDGVAAGTDPATVTHFLFTNLGSL